MKNKNDKNQIKDLKYILKKMEEARAEELHAERLKNGIIEKFNQLLEKREINKQLDAQIDESIKSKINISVPDKKYKLTK